MHGSTITANEQREEIWLMFLLDKRGIASRNLVGSGDASRYWKATYARACADVFFEAFVFANGFKKCRIIGINMRDPPLKPSRSRSP